MSGRIKFFIFLSFLIFNNSVSYCLENVQKIYEGAINSWFDGRVSDAIGGLEYVVYNSSDDNLTLKAGRDLIVLLNETNENSLAIAYADKLKAIKDDPYIEFEKTWALFSLNKYKQAADNIDEILMLTSDEDIVYFSRFLGGIIDINLNGYEKAMDDLQTVYKKYPSLLAPSSYLIADIYYKMDKKLASLNFLKDSLKYDSQNIQALIDLANLYEDSAYYLPAWQSFYTLKEIDYLNPYFLKKSEKLIKKIEKNPDDIFYWSRLGWPVHNEPIKERKPTTPIKISIYSDFDGTPSYLYSFYFISNVDFEIYDSVLGKTYTGKNNMQYKLEYIKSNRIYQLRDNSGSKVYSTRNNFEIRLKDPNGVILIKKPEIDERFFGVNKSDMELSSKIEVKVSTSGMKLYNDTYIEHIIPSMVSLIKGPKYNYEVLKALSLIVKTSVLKKIKESKNNIIVDSDNDFPFKGIQYENQNSINAFKDISDMIISDKNGFPYSASYSINAAGNTRNGVDDNSSKPKNLTPFELFRWLSFDFFKKQVNSIPEDQTQLSEISWLLILKPKWIEDRINTLYKVGNIKNIYVLKRNDFGIVKSVMVEGSAGNVEINGENEIKKIIFGNSLRSNLFYIRPVMKGKFPEFFIVKGVGSGEFKGLCLYGANYLANNMGYNYKQLIKHYFPDSAIK